MPALPVLGNIPCVAEEPILNRYIPDPSLVAIADCAIHCQWLGAGSLLLDVLYHDLSDCIAVGSGAVIALETHSNDGMGYRGNCQTCLWVLPCWHGLQDSVRQCQSLQRTWLYSGVTQCIQG